MEMDISDPPQSIFSEGKINIKKELGDGTLIKSETKGCTFQEGEPSTVKIEPADDILKCKNCGESFLTHKTLNDHNLANHEQDANDIYIKDEMFICEVCEEILGSEADFEDHKLRHLDEHSEDDEDEAENAFVCSVCNAIFESKDDVIGHKKSHSECYEHRKCNKCKDGSSEEFSCLWELIDHVKVQHGLKDEDTLDEDCNLNVWQTDLCEYYERTFSGRLALYLLQANQHPGAAISKPYSCSTCFKMFMKKEYLARHEKIHIRGKLRTRENKYSCNFCSRKFPMNCRLKQHLIYHTGEKNYKCNFCPKTFVPHSRRNKHQRTHSQQNNHFKCQFCNETFSRSYKLVNHELEHLPKSHSCSCCGKAYSNIFDRNIHERTCSEINMSLR